MPLRGGPDYTNYLGLKPQKLNELLLPKSSALQCLFMSIILTFNYIIMCNSSISPNILII